MSSRSMRILAICKKKYAENIDGKLCTTDTIGDPRDNSDSMRETTSNLCTFSTGGEFCSSSTNNNWPDFSENSGVEHSTTNNIDANSYIFDTGSDLCLPNTIREPVGPSDNRIIIEYVKPCASEGNFYSAVTGGDLYPLGTIIKPLIPSNISVQEYVKIDEQQDVLGTDDAVYSSFDDVDKDPNYSESSESSSSSSSSCSTCSLESQPTNNNDNISHLSTPINVEEHADLNLETARKGKKRIAKPLEWQKNKIKTLRNSGKEYVSSSKSNKSFRARTMKPACNDKCRLKCFSMINEEQRRFIFNKYWGLEDLSKQRSFIASCMQTVQPKYRYSNTNKRGLNHSFYLQINDKPVRVCKYFFKATLDINDRPIRTVISKTNAGFINEDLRGRHGKHQTVDEVIRRDMRQHIDSIPRIESHYLRAQTSREYIEGGKTITDLYEDYKQNCICENRPFGHRTMFGRIFNTEYNISFFKPKKDQCDLCVAYENSTGAEKESLEHKFNIHHEEKVLARTEKNLDKENVSDTFIVACYDLQAVLPCPKGESSSFYYKSKLNTYNTIFELKSNRATCYVWHEAQGNRGACEVGSCVYKFIEEKATSVISQDLEFVFFSDNCCGQQKNRFLISMYMHAVQTLPIKSITHKFLIKGHSQNEGDSVHSLIEKTVKRTLKSGPILLPHQYVTIIRNAKKNNPYQVKELSYDDFFDLKDLSAQYGTNFSKDVRGQTLKMNDLKIVKVEKNKPFTFFYKTSFKEGQFEEVCVRRTRNSISIDNISLKLLYSKKLEISAEKKKGLLHLLEKKQIPSCYREFYDSL